MCTTSSPFLLCLRVSHLYTLRDFGHLMMQPLTPAFNPVISSRLIISPFMIQYYLVGLYYSNMTLATLLLDLILFHLK